MSYIDFSSWPHNQEQTFVVYEKHANDSSRLAFVIALCAAIGVFVIALGIYAGVEPDKRDLGRDMNMSNLTKKEKKMSAPAPKPDTPAPAADQQKAPEAPAPAAPESK